MPLKERLAEGNEDALEDVDELDLAYLQRMKKSGGSAEAVSVNHLRDERGRKGESAEWIIYGFGY